ncbi:hypothetical protein MANES_11G147050v8 [Manihot esculenta]|uniref:Uncharacterized protein n=1 Tax=Manihot esculenta TaxID=3983 RepID=A0ACB7GX74_MANES|nr:hypothetical protein MANES_11G147050v8 [Manihot esculenta]
MERFSWFSYVNLVQNRALDAPSLPIAASSWNIEFCIIGEYNSWRCFRYFFFRPLSLLKINSQRTLLTTHNSIGSNPLTRMRCFFTFFFGSPQMIDADVEKHFRLDIW